MKDERTFYIEINGVEVEESSLLINDLKFISSTGTRELKVTYAPMYTPNYNKKIERGVQTIVDYIDKTSRYFKYMNGQKYIIYVRETIVVSTVLGSDMGVSVNTYIGHSEEHFYYKVKEYNVTIPFPDLLGGDINLWKTEGYEFQEKKVIKDNTPKKIKLSECREDYRELVTLIIKAIQQEGKSLQQSLLEKIKEPFSTIGNVATLVGGLVAFWSKSKNPVVTKIGTVSSFVGLATLASVFILSGVSPEDIVLEFPQKNDTTFWGVYRNHYTEQRSLLRTPSWGTKN